MAPFELVAPPSLPEALTLLGQGDPAVRPLGGGTALMLMMKAQFFQPVRLVSLHRIDALHGVAVAGDRLRIGAMTRFSQLEHSADVRSQLPVVVRAMPALANVRVRNVATVGGNLAHGDPHLDLPPIWMALDAEVRIAGPGGERHCPVAELFAGYYETTLADGELITELSVPLRPAWRSTYVKVTTRALHDWPALGLAIAIEPQAGRLRDVRVVLSGALDKATRLHATEDALRGQAVDEPLLQRAGEVAVQEAAIGSDARGSADYKSHLLRIHLARALRELAA